mgnify:CR=1 FL=1
MYRNREAAAEKLSSPYTTHHSKTPAKVGLDGEENYDPWLLWIPLTSSSKDCRDSHYGAFTPPTTDSERCADLQVGSSNSGIRTITQTQCCNNQGEVLKPILEVRHEGDMEVDGAMAPALKAPQAP